MPRRFSWVPLLVVLVLGGPSIPGDGLQGQGDAFARGTAGVGLLLRQLDGVKRVLIIGAHPDDEDTSLIAALARGMGARVAYLSLSRGEGGQNLIGEELDEGLGILRSGELMAARALDGGIQYFTRAFDFGYSKTAEETLEFWPRNEILADVTWVVREFRPQVVVSIFPEEGGHGQHQMAGIMAREAFHAAGDPSAFPQQLAAGVAPWIPAKLFRLSRFGPGDATVEVETGVFDPLLGRSHYQLAMESRSQHRSQDMGRPEPMGPRSSRLTLLESRVEGGDRGLFAGVDTTLLGLASEVPEPNRGRVRDALEAYRMALEEARSNLDATAPWRVTPTLQSGLEALRRARGAVTPEEAPDLHQVLDFRVPMVEEAVLRSAGIVMDVRVLDDLLVPGEEVELQVEVWNGGPYALRDPTVGLNLPAGWEAVPEESANAPIPPGEVGSWSYTLSLPREADLSRPYFLREAREGETYRWPKDTRLWGRPGNPPILTGALTGRIAEGSRVSVVRAGIYRGVDKALGEYVENPLVVPALSVALDPTVQIWPLGMGEARVFTVRIRNEASRGRRGTVALELPPGWRSEPASQPFGFGEDGVEATFSFSVIPPADRSPGMFQVGAVARTGEGEVFREGVRIVDYPHIRRAALFFPARARVSVFPVEAPQGLRVGYVMGSGDMGPQVLRQMGVEVDLLGPDVVRSGDFQHLDAIVLGIRAYETRPDVAAANQQLLDFARRGGTLVVQYNKYEFPAGEFAPFPVEMNRPHDRVVDETAPVRLLDPGHPLFNTPNHITDADFRGWAQERGLYFLREWDPRLTPLLEMADPGEDPKRGALLVAPLGDGLYVYTGVAFFRQFPEGVPGAVRLFANLVSLQREDLNEG